jgi:hypothetical protein
MNNKRILELALETLQKQRAVVEAEIEAVRSELRGLTGIPRANRAGTAAPLSGRRRPKSPAEKKAQSERMKAYWAAKRAGSVKAPSGRKARSQSRRRRVISAAARKAQSLKMKQIWAQRKAEAAKAAGAKTGSKQSPRQPKA